MSIIKYPGIELDIFRSAKNWKKYFASHVRPLLYGKVLEVGAGNGSTTQHLYNNQIKSWTCLEPDPLLFAQVTDLITSDKGLDCCEAINGTLSSLNTDNKFDVILYIDVLEHIENDVMELELASTLLKAEGIMVILCPAYQWLYTEFDKSIGHYRRYNKTALAGVIPPSFEKISLYYLDSIGVCASLVNRIFLHQKTPTYRQIQLWDKVIIRLSRLIDPLIFNSFGKSIIGVWKKL